MTRFHVLIFKKPQQLTQLYKYTGKMHVKTMRKHFTDILNNIYLYNIYRVLVVDSDCCTHIQLFYQRPKIPTYTRKFILYNIIQHTVYFLEQKHTHTHTRTSSLIYSQFVPVLSRVLAVSHTSE